MKQIIQSSKFAFILSLTLLSLFTESSFADVIYRSANASPSEYKTYLSRCDRCETPQMAYEGSLSSSSKLKSDNTITQQATTEEVISNLKYGPLDQVNIEMLLSLLDQNLERGKNSTNLPLEILGLGSVHPHLLTLFPEVFNRDSLKGRSTRFLNRQEIQDFLNTIRRQTGLVDCVLHINGKPWIDQSSFSVKDFPMQWTITSSAMKTKFFWGTWNDFMIWAKKLRPDFNLTCKDLPNFGEFVFVNEQCSNHLPSSHCATSKSSVPLGEPSSFMGKNESWIWMGTLAATAATVFYLRDKTVYVNFGAFSFR